MPSLSAKVTMNAIWGKKVKADEQNHFLGLPNDIILLVMGPTGAGKSTFIKKYSNNNSIPVGDGLESCTHDVTAYHVPMQEAHSKSLWCRRLILVDTPGFDDSRGNDVEILTKVSNWLKRAYTHALTVAGIIYITAITQNRMNGSARLNLSMFMKLCGASSYKKIVMVTSHWEELIIKEKGIEREGSLIGDYWKDIIDGGARTGRIVKSGGHHEGLIIQDIIEVFLKLEAEGQATDPMLIQYELVDWHKTIPTTQAGRELRSNLKEILKLKSQQKANKLDKKMQLELEAKKVSLRKQIEELNLPMDERIKRFFSFSG